MTDELFRTEHRGREVETIDVSDIDEIKVTTEYDFMKIEVVE